MKKKLVILFLIATMVFGTFSSYSSTDAYSVVNTNNGTVIYNVDGFPDLLGKYIDGSKTYILISHNQASKTNVDDAAKWMIEHNRNIYPSPTVLSYANADTHGNWYRLSKDAMTTYALTSGNTLYKGWDLIPLHISDIAGAVETIAKYEGIEVAIKKVAQTLTWNRLIIENSDEIYYLSHGVVPAVRTLYTLTPTEDIMAMVTNVFIEGYTSNNPDIAAIYGSDLEALKTHYENNGKAEGRIISSTYLEDPWTSLRGLLNENTREYDSIGDVLDAYDKIVGIREGYLCG